jgi:hypothetical protein
MMEFRMRWAVAVAIGSMLVSACGKAQAIAPDSTNPAHCIAAFHWGAYWFSVTTPKHTPNREKIAEMVAHARYELNKIKASGASVEAAKKQGEELTKAYAKEGKKLDELMLDCSIAQANDPEFRKQWQSLLASARSEAANYPTH